MATKVTFGSLHASHAQRPQIVIARKTVRDSRELPRFRIGANPHPLRG